MVKRKTPGKSSASPKKQKSEEVRAYQRQSTLVAGLREENDEEGLPEEQGMELRPHHRTDEHYTKPKPKSKKASKKATPRKTKKATKKSTPRKTATPAPKKKSTSPKIAVVATAVATKASPVKESSPNAFVMTIIVVVLLATATMMGAATGSLNLLAHDADSDGDVDVAEMSTAIALSCDQSNSQVCITDIWVTMNPQDKEKTDTEVANAIVVAYDTDNDGDLDGEDLTRATEKLTALATTTEITLLVHDHDNDGDVDVAELTSTIGQHCDAESQTCLKDIWFAAHPDDKAAMLDDAAVAKKIIEEFDTDKDGDLGGEELIRANAQFNVRFDKHGNVARPSWVVDWVDTGVSTLEGVTNSSGAVHFRKLCTKHVVTAGASTEDAQEACKSLLDAQSLEVVEKFNQEIFVQEMYETDEKLAQLLKDTDERATEAAQKKADAAAKVESDRRKAFMADSEELLRLSQTWKAADDQAAQALQDTADARAKSVTDMAAIYAETLVKHLHGEARDSVLAPIHILPNKRMTELDEELAQLLQATKDERAKVAQENTDADNKAAADAKVKAAGRSRQLLNFVAELKQVDELAAQAEQEATAAAAQAAKAATTKAKDTAVAFVKSSHRQMKEKEAAKKLADEKAAAEKLAAEKAAQEAADEAAAQAAAEKAAAEKAATEKAAQEAAAAKAAQEAADKAAAQAAADQAAADKAAEEKAAADKLEADKIAMLAQVTTWLNDHPEEAAKIFGSSCCDTNGDGKLDGKELEEITKKHDTNGDGKMDGEELVALGAAARAAVESDIDDAVARL